jgi:iron complex transport system ATP-binding protein
LTTCDGSSPYEHHLVALQRGRAYAAGAPSEIVDDVLVKQVFGLDSRVLPDPVTGTPMCVPIGRRVPAS